MDNQLFSTILYIVSTLVQADAAIFSLGAIFVIYRLQSLDSGFQNAFLAVGASNNSSRVNELLRLRHENFLPSKAASLINYQGSVHEPHMRTVAYTEIWKKGIMRRSIPIFVALVVHMSLSAIIFLIIPRMDKTNIIIFRELAIADVTTFIILIFFITWTIVNMLFDDPIAATVYFPEIKRILPNTFPALIAYNEGRPTPSLFEFQIQKRTFYVALDPRNNEKYSIRIFTINPLSNKLQSHSQHEDKAVKELTEIWNTFISKPEEVLPPLNGIKAG
jgi:hypothetical protein